MLSPAVSDYSHNSIYKTYDITAYLNKGRNCVGIWYAPGWYRRDVRDYYGVSEPVPLARARVNISLQDGTEFSVCTDRSWKVKMSEREMIGKWIWGDFGGEYLDGTKMDPTWSLPDYNDSEWEHAYNYRPPRVPALAQRCEDTKILGTYPVREIERIGEDEFLVDFGTVLTGWIDVKMRGQETGREVTIRYADKIIHPGDDTSPLEMSFTYRVKGDPEERLFVLYNQLDRYRTAGREEESYCSKFNYHAFRYLLVSGLEGLDAGDIKAIMIGTELDQVARVETSNPLLNGIWSLINHTYRCLTHTGYVVDCPHRERIGYGGDSHSSLETSLCNFNMSPLFNKWMIDWRANNYPNGLWPGSAPEPPQHNYGFNPGWGSFGIALPWRYYVYYGDTLNLGRSYPYVKKFITYMNLNRKDGILYNASERSAYQSGWIGDWVPPGYDMGKGKIDELSTNLFNNCIYIYAVDMARKMAQVLGFPEDEAYFEGLIRESGDRIHKRFYNPATKDYVNGQQPYLAFPLLVGIVPQQEQEAVFNRLEHLIMVENKGHLQSGMLGTHFLFEYLMKAGRNDLIYTMVNQKTWPGWGYMLEQGATTVWEQWNGHNSQVHNCYLAGGAWFVRGLGGIRADEENPGMKHFYIKPAFIKDLSFSNVDYQSRYGEIASHWERSNNGIDMQIELPCNTTATLILPGDFKAIRINGKKKKKEGIYLKGNLSFELASGKHQIELNQ